MKYLNKRKFPRGIKRLHAGSQLLLHIGSALEKGTRVTPGDYPVLGLYLFRPSFVAFQILDYDDSQIILFSENDDDVDCRSEINRVTNSCD